jgi:Fe-S cluster biogenesis protein NfuA
MPAQPEFQQRLQSIERLLGKIEAAADPDLRTTVQELVQLVMDLHGAGLGRMLELIRAAGDGGVSIIQKLGRDELVASLLVLYGLHPIDIEARVNQALDKVRSRLRAREGEVELLTIQDGAVRLRLHANGRGCGSTADALKEMVEEAVYQTAPDITSLVIEGAGERQGFVQLEVLQGTAPASHLSNGLTLIAGDKGRS